MSGERALPGQASLRYLKVAAKRRHAAGEFATLHDAQLAVARENGQPSWAALRRAVEVQQAADGRAGHAAGQLRWITARFSGAGEPGWGPPDDAELREHFTGEFLAAVPPARLIAMITDIGPALRAGLVITGETPFAVYGRLGDFLVHAVTETRPPYRVTGARARRLGTGTGDPRVQQPPVTADGPAPEGARTLARQAMAQFGLVALALAGADGGAPGAGAAQGAEPWAVWAGWASLERAEPLHCGHAFPAFQVTTAVTAVAVLCLAGAGALRLDDPANAHLAGTRLADDAVTIRELLSHTGGVTSPPALFVAPGTDNAEPEPGGPGPVLACTGRRGAFAFSHAGYAALGEVVAARAGVPYPEAVTRLVLRPLGMNASVFTPGRPAAPVTGYGQAADGAFTPLGPRDSAFPAAAGLWSTAADLARFGRDWDTLLPRSLAAQALRPHARHPNGTQVGLGWIINEAAGLAGLAGDGPHGAASLLVRLGGRRARAALTSRPIDAEPVNAAALTLTSAAGCG